MPLDPRLAEELAVLAKMPAWQRLVEYLEEKQAAKQAEWGVLAMSGNLPDEQTLTFFRGFYQGARYIVNRPVKALDQIDKAAELAAKAEEAE